MDCYCLVAYAKLVIGAVNLYSPGPDLVSSSLCVWALGLFIIPASFFHNSQTLLSIFDRSWERKEFSALLSKVVDPWLISINLISIWGINGGIFYPLCKGQTAFIFTLSPEAVNLFLAAEAERRVSYPSSSGFACIPPSRWRRRKICCLFLNVLGFYFSWKWDLGNKCCVLVPHWQPVTSFVYVPLQGAHSVLLLCTHFSYHYLVEAH